MHVLLVEDNTAAREALMCLLSEEGYKVTPARDAEEALRACCPKNMDIAILELRLPGMWGDQLAVQLTKLEPSPRIIFFDGANAHSR